jgi:hypothetical protein
MFSPVLLQEVIQRNLFHIVILNPLEEVAMKNRTLSGNRCC